MNLLWILYATALTADCHTREVVGHPEVIKGTCGSADTIYKGSIVCFAPSGYVNVYTRITDWVPVGVAKKQTTVAGSNAETIEIITGKIWIAHSSAAQTNVGMLAYGVDDNAITVSSTVGLTPCGRVIGYKSGYVLIDFRDKAPTRSTV